MTTAAGADGGSNVGTTRRLRIALLHYAAHPEMGGVEAVMERQRRLLVERGHSVTVISGRGAGTVIPMVDSRHPAIEEFTVRLRNLGPSTQLATDFDQLREAIAEQLREPLHGVDVVVVHNVMTMPFNLPLTAVLASLPVPLVAWTHDVAAANPRYVAFHESGFPYDLITCAAAGTTYVAISTVRQQELETTLGIPAANVPVVPNGVDVAELLGLRPATIDLLRRLGLTAANPLLLAPSRLTRRKRIELLIEAAPRVIRAHPHARFLVTGPSGPHDADSGRYAAELISRRNAGGLEGSFVFAAEFDGVNETHVVDDATMADLYRITAAVLLPSESEGFGLPLLEAGVLRVPVVCSDLDVFRQAGGRDTWRVPVDAGGSAFAAGILAALRSRTARLQMRATERSWDRLAPLLETTLVQAIG